MKHISCEHCGSSDLMPCNRKDFNGDCKLEKRGKTFEWTEGDAIADEIQEELTLAILEVLKKQRASTGGGEVKADQKYSQHQKNFFSHERKDYEHIEPKRNARRIKEKTVK